MTQQRHVIPNGMRDLLNVALCQHVEILYCVQDDETETRHPEWNEGSP
ncbi:hypothetical protein [Legionella bononiensis]|nr:hypothetical protein [Legionella bononiensis]